MRSRVTIHHQGQPATHTSLPAHEQAARAHRAAALHLPNIPHPGPKPQPEAPRTGRKTWHVACPPPRP